MSPFTDEFDQSGRRPPDCYISVLPRGSIKEAAGVLREAGSATVAGVQNYAKGLVIEYPRGKDNRPCIVPHRRGQTRVVLFGG
jgi:hypothetical protein